MKEKGFITSALLYGILSLFFVLILGVLSAVSSRKLSINRLKESALIDAENLRTSESCFEINKEVNTCTIETYNFECGSTIFINRNNISSCETKKLIIKDDSIKGVTDGYVYIKGKKDEIEIEQNAFIGNDNVTFITSGFDIDKDGTLNDLWGATNSYLKAY
ncbi:MAG: hypothetical protein IKF91_04970 [Bacilli bacterium]|nr:hypothetical protein [Bacilli bacterium]